MVNSYVNRFLILALLLGVLGSPSYAQVINAWVNTYDGYTSRNDWIWDIAVDPEGNSYVTGMSEWADGDQDYITIKYDTYGNTAWWNRYDGPAVGIDFGWAVDVDGSGNCYVTGKSEDTDGGSSYATIKYSPSGSQLWASRYHGSVAVAGDGAYALTLDDAGNVYVTGGSFGTYGTDIATVKYNSSGTQQWVARYNGPANGWETGSAITVDGAGNVYVTGYSDGSTSIEYVTIKYNSSGTQQWATRYNGPGDSWDYPEDIEIDESGNVYITGRSEGSGTDFDFATIKYNSSGSQQWVARYDGYTSGFDQAWGLGLDAAGNVYVTGDSEWSYPDEDWITVKYNNNGVQQWEARHDGPAVNNDVPSDLEVDAAGNILVTGRDMNSNLDVDCVTIKYDHNGTELWLARYDGGTDIGDVGTAVGFDADDNVYVGGTTYTGSANSNDYLTMKITPILDVQAIPDATVVPRGGTLRMTVSVTNRSGSAQPVSFWTNVTLPNGNTYPGSGILFGPVYGTIPAYGTQQAVLPHHIPGFAPLLTYGYNAFVGQYLWSPWDRDAFQFTVVNSE